MSGEKSGPALPKRIGDPHRLTPAEAANRVGRGSAIPVNETAPSQSSQRRPKPKLSLTVRATALAMVAASRLRSLRGGSGAIFIHALPARAAPTASAVPEIHSVAVLPLRNLSGDPNQEYFADGTTLELITTLTKISKLRVISWTSVRGYKNTTKTLPEIAKELNVDGVIEGLWNAPATG